MSATVPVNGNEQLETDLFYTVPYTQGMLLVAYPVKDVQTEFGFEYYLALSPYRTPLGNVKRIVKPKTETVQVVVEEKVPEVPVVKPKPTLTPKPVKVDTPDPVPEKVVEVVQPKNDPITIETKPVQNQPEKVIVPDKVESPSSVKNIESNIKKIVDDVKIFNFDIEKQKEKVKTLITNTE